jgi:hypothetical protein
MLTADVCDVCWRMLTYQVALGYSNMLVFSNAVCY